MHRSQVERLKSEIAGLEGRAADERQRATRERDAALRAASSITKSTSPSSVRSKLADASRHEGRAADHDKRAAGFASQAAAKTKQLHSAERSLESALGQERKKVEAEDRRRRDTELGTFKSSRGGVGSLRRITSPRSRRRSSRLLIVGATHPASSTTPACPSPVRSVATWSWSRVGSRMRAYASSTTRTRRSGYRQGPDRAFRSDLPGPPATA